MKKHFNFDDADKCTKCYKCVRECPSKAIKIVEDTVMENEELCIDCGKCASVCNKGVHIKGLDIGRLEDILNDNKVIALLDTTYFMNTKAKRMNQIEEALTMIGFDIVESAYDGMAIHDYLINKSFDENKGIILNSNCMPFNNYVEKFYPELVDKLLQYRTATEISGLVKKKKYGTDTKVVLITNCFGDFSFEDTSRGIDYVLLESELDDYLKNRGINIEEIEPIDKKYYELKVNHLSGISPAVITGVKNCKNVLEYVKRKVPDIESPLRFFLCEGTCFNSNAINNELVPFEREQEYFSFLRDNFIFEDNPELLDKLMKSINDFKCRYLPIGNNRKRHSNATIRSTLESIGICEDSDEYDCNACGYGSCKRFGVAILDDMAYMEQCTPYLTRVNRQQSKKMEQMFMELNEAFALTIPDNRLEKKFKTTPVYAGGYDSNTDYLEITRAIEGGLYNYTINCLKLAGDLKDCEVFDLIGINKGILVQTILFHCNARTEPVLSVGDVIRYGDWFEDRKEEALRSAEFAKQYYGVNDEIYLMIKYQKHNENELPTDFPKHLLPVFRLFRVLSLIAMSLTRNDGKIKFKFRFEDFLLYIQKTLDGKCDEYVVDLYREHDFMVLDSFAKG